MWQKFKEQILVVIVIAVLVIGATVFLNQKTVAELTAQQDAKLAMALHAKNVHYKLNDIRLRHWNSLAQTSGVEGLWDRMIALVHSIDKALTTVEAQLPATFPAAIWEKVSSGTLKQAAQFVREERAD